jgi:hypothetical protein
MMANLTLRDRLTLIAFVLALLVFLVYILSLIRARRADQPLTRFLLGAPLWFVTPSRFFDPGKRAAPWRGLLWWFLFVLVISALAKMIPVWIR